MMVRGATRGGGDQHGQRAYGGGGAGYRGRGQAVKVVPVLSMGMSILTYGNGNFEAGGLSGVAKSGSG
jgi:hypothetical protein